MRKLIITALLAAITVSAKAQTTPSVKTVETVTAKCPNCTELLKWDFQTIEGGFQLEEPIWNAAAITVDWVTETVKIGKETHKMTAYLSRMDAPIDVVKWEGGELQVHYTKLGGAYIGHTYRID